MSTNCFFYFRNFMMLFYVIETLIAIICACLTAATNYCEICPKRTHTMCKYETISPFCIDYKAPMMTPDIKRRIIGIHNKLRNNVAAGNEKRGNPGPQPPAADMMVVEWDDELQNIAQRLIDQCGATDAAEECRKTDRFDVGQNSLAGFDNGDFAYMVHYWYNEVDQFDSAEVLGFNGSKNSPKVNDYTQLVWAKTRYVGCGYATYLDTSNILDTNQTKTIYKFVCNYGPTGNIEGAPVYKNGAPCVLCECDGLYEHLCKHDVTGSHYFGNVFKGKSRRKITDLNGIFTTMTAVGEGLDFSPNVSTKTVTNIKSVSTDAGLIVSRESSTFKGMQILAKSNSNRKDDNKSPKTLNNQTHCSCSCCKRWKLEIKLAVITFTLLFAQL